MSICQLRNSSTNKLLHQVFKECGALMNPVDKAIWLKVGNIVTYQVLNGILSQIVENDI
jgi:hypothetical protein